MTTTNISGNIDSLLNTRSITTLGFYGNDAVSTAQGGIEQEPVIDADALIQFLGWFSVTFESRSHFHSFVTHYSELIPLLHKLPDRVSKYFSDGTVSIAIVKSYEDENAIPELHIRIKTSLDYPIAKEKLSEIRREWVYQLTEEGAEYIHISLDI